MSEFGFAHQMCEVKRLRILPRNTKFICDRWVHLEFQDGGVKKRGPAPVNIWLNSHVYAFSYHHEEKNCKTPLTEVIYANYQVKCHVLVFINMYRAS